MLRWLRIATLALSVFVGLTTLVTALVHIDDDFGIDHVGGTWIALARYVNHGVLYPPLFTGSAFGGTLDMPLQFVIHAGLAHVTGDYLVSGKLLALAAACALYTVLFCTCRRITGSLAISAGLVAAVLSSETGFARVTSVRADALPVAFQLAALYLVAWATPVRARHVAVAGVLCGLAFLTKLSALWAAVAIAIWLGLYARRQLPVFLGAALGSAGLGAIAFELASHGRMGHNVFPLAEAGGYVGWRETLLRLVSNMQDSASSVWVLLPIGTVALLFAIKRRRFSAYQIAWLAAALILVRVLEARGATANHLIDIEALTAILVAETVALAQETRAADFVLPLVFAAIIWGTVGSYERSVRPYAGPSLRILFGGHNPYTSGPVLRGTLTRNDRFLTDDPYVAVSMHENPVVLDTFMLIPILRQHPHWLATLRRQITQHRFSKVVLEMRLNPGGGWNQTYSLGTPIATTLAKNYRLTGVRGNSLDRQYYVYVPR